MTSWLGRCFIVGAMVGGLSAGYPGLALAQEAATPAKEVAPERMMTLQERSALREEMRKAQTPQEREAIMSKKMGELRQKAAVEGAALAEPGARRARNGNGNGNNNGNGNGAAMAESNGGRAEMAPRMENGPGGTMRPRPPAGH